MTRSPTEEDVQPIVVVAVLEVRRSELDAFRTFEEAAAKELVLHGGRLERVVVSDDGTGETLTEIHLMRFSSAECLAAYRRSPTLASLRGLREAAVLATNVHVGVDGPRPHATSGDV